MSDKNREITYQDDAVAQIKEYLNDKPNDERKDGEQ